MSDTLLNLLLTGCDERIFLDPATGTNKYHLNPLEFDGLLQRGSCTCSPLTPDGLRVAKSFQRHRSHRSYPGLMAEQARRLRDLFRGDEDDRFHVVFCPSGSDAMFLPLVFQRLLNPDRPIVNIVSCREELGSGSITAAQGRYYASWTQLGERVRPSEPVEGAGDVVTHYLSARDVDGHIPDRRAAIRERIEASEDCPIIGNLVFGSKSGIKDDLAIVDEFSTDVMWVVDMCQFRVDLDLVHALLMKGVMIMVTGSKFYQAPPFCGALLVPESWTERIAACDPRPAAAWARLFTRWDFPPVLEGVRDQLPDFRNWGLRLRWAVALEEMEAYKRIPKSRSDAWIRDWNAFITAHLSGSDTFTLMPDMEKTNQSIISFNVSAGGRHLGPDDLKTLFDTLVTSRHEGLGPYDRFFLGQPVDYGTSAFIRVAVGSHTVRKAIEAGSFDFGPDRRVLELIAGHADELFA